MRRLQMRQQRFPRVTPRTGVVSPAAKAAYINDKMGNPNIKKQQGTTRALYDTLPLDGRTQYDFFLEANARQFPLTNLTASGNRLNVGETLVVQRSYLALVVIAAGVFTTIAPIDSSSPAISGGELNFTIANRRVIKDFPIMSTNADFNKSSQYDGQVLFEFDNDIVIPPLLEFYATIRVANGTTTADTYYRYTIEGLGAILAPETTF